MSYCRNHARAPGAGRCAGCAEEYCKNCILELSGQNYCAACKLMALEGRTPSMVAAAMELNEPKSAEAQQAFTTAIIGFITGGLGCFYIAGFICGVIGIAKGVTAKKNLIENPSRMGSFQSTAAIVLGCMAILLNLLNIAFRVAAKGQN